jgi:electron-transferring-flavoprotein dehydrogenase
MVAPGVALLGCSAGLVNVPRIKGNHNAMLSGKAAAEAAYAAIQAGRQGDELSAYEADVRGGAIGADLKKVRNVKPMWSKFGLIASLMAGGADMWANTFGLTVLGTLKHGKNDAESTGLAKDYAPIDYPKPDGVLSFDRLTNVAFSATNHDENQPAHLRLRDASIPIMVNLPQYAEPAQRYCPAGVYEVIAEDGKAPRFQINFQNCVHCKTCDIKDPSQNITWTTPIGGGGPNYPNM